MEALAKIREMRICSTCEKGTDGNLVEGSMEGLM